VKGQIFRIALIAALVWTLAMIGSLVNSVQHERNRVSDVVEARDNYERNLYLIQGGLWLLGMIGIGWSANRLRDREQERRELMKAVRVHARRFDLALHGSQDGIWDIHLETNQVYHSPRMHEMLGYLAGELPVNLTYWRAIAHVEDYDRVMAAMREHVEGRSETFDAVFRARSKFGEWRWLRCRGKAVRDEQGKAVRVVGTQTDITDSKELERQLHAEKERAQVTLASIGEAVLTTDAEGNISFLNPAAERLSGWPARDAVGMPVEAVMVLISEETRETLPSPFQRCRETDQLNRLPAHTLLITRTGNELAIDDSVAPIHDGDGRLVGMVMVFQDVSESREMTRRMNWQISHDALTGLASRREFEHRLEGMVEDARRSREQHALLYLDLDNFKIVNDTCGHLAGDELLKQLAFLLSEQMRRNDTLARLGGDEFGALLERCPLDKARMLADKLRQTVSEFRFVWGGKTFEIGVSIGLVMVGPDTTSLTEALSMADLACYAAKEQGRNRVHIYSAEDQEGLNRHREMLLATDIRAALDADSFVLFGQELLPLRGQPGRQIEVLVRMQGDRGELVPPGAFIPAAERYGLMPLVDRWVVEQALQALRKAGASGDDVRLSINLSGLCFGEAEMPAWMGRVILDSGIDPGRITFEITETAAVAQMARGVHFMRELKALGCRFALDDFGSGMSSFAYLKTLPVDVLKIDGAFVRDLSTDNVDRAFVEAIIRVADILGMETVAEYAEQPEVITTLAEIGVHYVQGFAVGKPRPLNNLLSGI
jgi:diguanylate cyclase (GGDEF)-like protein/PAS domain S-box-containing protein